MHKYFIQPAESGFADCESKVSGLTSLPKRIRDSSLGEANSSSLNSHLLDACSSLLWVGALSNFSSPTLKCPMI